MSAPTENPMPLAPKWQVFDKRATPLVKRPEVTVQAKGTLSMNVSAYYALGKPEAVELLWDEEQSLIGFRPVEKEAPHAYPIRGVQSGSTFMVSGTAFFAYFNIPLVAPVRRDAKVIDGVLILDLKDPGRDATSNRNKRKRMNGSRNGATATAAHTDSPLSNVLSGSASGDQPDSLPSQAPDS